MENKVFKIYVLKDPINGEIRYVGQTIKSLENRLYKHLKSKDNTHRVKWINSLIKENRVPIIELLCNTDSIDKCNELEIFYIKKYREMGLKLVNSTDGGRGSLGYKHTKKTKKLLSELTKNRMSSKSIRNHLKEKGLKQWEKYTTEQKINNMINQPNRKDVYQYDMNGDFIKKFDSLRQIERELGFFRANISPCLKGKFKQAYGYIWRYE